MFDITTSDLVHGIHTIDRVVSRGDRITFRSITGVLSRGTGGTRYRRHTVGSRTGWALVTCRETRCVGEKSNTAFGTCSETRVIAEGSLVTRLTLGGTNHVCRGSFFTLFTRRLALLVIIHSHVTRSAPDSLDSSHVVVLSNRTFILGTNVTIMSRRTQIDTRASNPVDGIFTPYRVMASRYRLTRGSIHGKFCGWTRRAFDGSGTIRSFTRYTLIASGQTRRVSKESNIASSTYTKARQVRVRSFRTYRACRGPITRGYGPTRTEGTFHLENLVRVFSLGTRGATRTFQPTHVIRRSNGALIGGSQIT